MRNKCEKCGSPAPSKHDMDMMREEEKLLTAFKGNSELIECMAFLNDYYCRASSPVQLQKPVTVPCILRALCKSDSESRRFAKHALEYKARTEQRINDLIAVVNFMREACSRRHEGVSVTSTGRTIDLADVFATIDDHLEEMKDKHCPLTYVDYMKHILSADGPSRARDGEGK